MYLIHHTGSNPVLITIKTKVMEQKKLVEQLIKASNKISKNRKPSANYIHLSEEYIQEQANERKISFDNMVEIIKKELMPKTNNYGK
jgi:hypothetical protein